MRVLLQWALYCLIWFFKALFKELKGMRGLSKLLCVKALVFFTFWQNMTLNVLTRTGTITATDTESVDEVSGSWAVSVVQQKLQNVPRVIAWQPSTKLWFGGRYAVCCAWFHQSFVICIEMLGFSIAHHWIYSFKDYQSGTLLSVSVACWELIPIDLWQDLAALRRRRHAAEQINGGGSSGDDDTSGLKAALSPNRRSPSLDATVITKNAVYGAVDTTP